MVWPTHHCSIRHILAEVGAAIVQTAAAEELAEGHSDVEARELTRMSKLWNMSHTTCGILFTNLLFM
ncbi:hypothetical protein CsSME_00023975 [Camellia sinensis var. sinensis]